MTRCSSDLDGQRERQGDYVLTANTVGEYAFCFENDEHAH